MLRIHSFPSIAFIAHSNGSHYKINHFTTTQTSCTINTAKEIKVKIVQIEIASHVWSAAELEKKARTRRTHVNREHNELVWCLQMPARRIAKTSRFHGITATTAPITSASQTSNKFFRNKNFVHNRQQHTIERKTLDVPSNKQNLIINHKTRNGTDHHRHQFDRKRWNILFGISLRWSTKQYNQFTHFYWYGLVHKPPAAPFSNRMHRSQPSEVSTKTQQFLLLLFKLQVQQIHEWKQKWKCQRTRLSESRREEGAGTILRMEN